jgi:fermentation-respiration switch protein FrsA (DUF1100 family)
MTQKLNFPSGAQRCVAWLTLPICQGPHPVVVLVHGGGATHEMKLGQYEAAFSAAGFAVLAFDYRHFGESEGLPRQIMSVRKHLEDVDAALAFVQTRPELDASRVALWGTSMGASHVVTAASGWQNLFRLGWPIASDLLRSFVGLPRHYVQIVGRSTELAFVNVAGAYEGWYSVVPEGHKYDNRVTASSAIGMLFYDAASKASKVQCPLLICVSDNEGLMNPAVAVQAASRAPRGEAIHYPADHFEVYHSPVFEQIAADQIAFLSRHLHPGKVTAPRPHLAPA